MGKSTFIFFEISFLLKRKSILTAEAAATDQGSEAGAENKGEGGCESNPEPGLNIKQSYS